nr:MAG TPA: hypothetical protein [Caudoviricetes sp.]
MVIKPAKKAKVLISVSGRNKAGKITPQQKLTHSNT